MQPPQNTPVPATRVCSPELTDAIYEAMNGSIEAVQKASAKFVVVDAQGVASLPAALSRKKKEKLVRVVWKAMKPVVKMCAEEWAAVEKKKKKMEAKKKAKKGKGKKKAKEEEKTLNEQEAKAMLAELVRREIERVRRARYSLAAQDDKCYCAVDFAGEVAEESLPSQEELIRVFMERFWSSR